MSERQIVVGSDDWCTAPDPFWHLNPILLDMGAVRFYDYADDHGSTLSERLGRCYELSGRSMFPTHIDRARTQGQPVPIGLIHGSMHGPDAPTRIKHAWLLLNSSEIWEPASGLVYDGPTFKAYARAEVDSLFDAVEANRLLMKHEHFGPWM